MAGKEIVAQRRAMAFVEMSLALMPEVWDYSESVKKVRAFIYKWKNLTGELANELWIARAILSEHGGDRKSEEYQRNKSSIDSVSSETKTWSQYCKDIGCNKSTVNRWLDRFFPQELPMGHLSHRIKHGTKVPVITSAPRA